jgi:hypothetical protein
MSEEKKKVDQEWKKRAEKEKQRFVRAGREEEAREAPLPEANFTQLVTGLATQVLIHLGEVGDPITQKRTVNLEQARYTIDLLHILEQKTKGNLTDEESRILAGLLDDLHWRFVKASDSASG